MPNITKLYWISFFRALIPAYVIERLFWQQRGMSVQMVVYTEIIYALTVVIFEIPSGILADKFGRKTLMVLYHAFAAIELGILLMAHSFWQFALAIVLAGIGKAFVSGSENALLYDTLLNAQKQEDYEKVAGRITAIDLAGSLVAALSGSILAYYFDMEFNYLVSIGSAVIAFAWTLTLKEPPQLTPPESETKDMWQHARKAMDVFVSQPAVLMYCLSGAVIGSCMIYVDEFWQIVLDNAQLPVLFFGLVSAMLMLVRIPANLFAYKLKEHISYHRFLMGILVLSTVCYALIFTVRSLWSVVPMMIIAALAAMADPLVGGYLHHHTESHVRATAESFSSLGLRMVSALSGLVFGYLSTQLSIYVGFAFLGVLCGLYVLFFGTWAARYTAKG